MQAQKIRANGQSVHQQSKVSNLMQSMGFDQGSMVS